MMSSDGYRTIAGSGETAFRVQGSRFIGHVAPAASTAAAADVIGDLDASHPDATHVVPAYRVRTDPFREYQDDAGEPAGSAGGPMLSVLQGEGLENVVAVVVRYYGGTNLGIGGLVRAYGESVKRALAATQVITREPHVPLIIETAYDDSGTVRSILDGSAATFDAEYQERVRFAVDVPQQQEAELRDRVMSATSGRASIDPR